MNIVKWEQLPVEMQTLEVKRYYNILKGKRCYLFLKRLFDIVVSTLALIVLSPLFLLLAIMIKMDSTGPVFYRQERVTQYGKRFFIHKFRTMVANADEGSQLTLNNDGRITRVGRFIRGCRLDETAQLIDVISGKLTLVGTRPEIPQFVERYSNEMMATLLLPAGVTSLACVYYKDEAKLLDGLKDADRVYVEKILPAKMHYNLKEIETLSFKNDIKILFMTVFAIFGKEYRDNCL